jgi:hypothetical protein
MCDPDAPYGGDNSLTSISPLNIAVIWGAVYFERLFVGLHKVLAESVIPKLGGFCAFAYLKPRDVETIDQDDRKSYIYAD